jgi:predicted butyrate kinase (DUF1464 family)
VFSKFGKTFKVLLVFFATIFLIGATVVVDFDGTSVADALVATALVDDFGGTTVVDDFNGAGFADFAVVFVIAKYCDCFKAIRRIGRIKE